MNFIFGRKCSMCDERKRFPRNQVYCDECVESFRRCDSCRKLCNPKELRFVSANEMDICRTCRNNKPPYVCEHCKRNWSNIYNLEKHQQNCRENPANQKTPYVGPCGYKSYPQPKTPYDGPGGPRSRQQANIEKVFRFQEPNSNNLFSSFFGNDNQNSNQQTNSNDIFSSFFGNNNTNDVLDSFFGQNSNNNNHPKPNKKEEFKLPEGEDTLAEEDTKDENICKICCENMANTINLPCCHIFFCIKCANKYGETKQICPVCKDNMTAIKRTFK